MPLGNYHNQGPKGYAAEYVSMRDYDNFLKLLHAVARQPMPKDVLGGKVCELWAHYRSLKKKLTSSL